MGGHSLDARQVLKRRLALFRDGGAKRGVGGAAELGVQSHRGTQPSHRWVLVVAMGILLLGVAVACGGTPRAAAPAATSQGGGSCGVPQDPVLGAAPSIASVVGDVTGSTMSPELNGRYRLAALAAVDRAATMKGLVRLVAFGASGVGARLVFSESFATASSDEVLNLAAANRTRCFAKGAIDAMFDGRPIDHGGSDVAGALSSEISTIAMAAPTTATLTVTVITDGCQAPARTGPNRHLTDLCRELARGMSIGQVLRQHPREFRLPDATRRVTIVMKGVGIGRDPTAANTLQARRLVAFWQLVCSRAKARGCVIGSAVP